MRLGRSFLAVALATSVIAVSGGGSAAFGFAASAQEQKSITARLDEADRLKAEKRFDEARGLYDTAVAQAREGMTEDIVARALLGRADLFLWIRQWDRGIQDAREALELCARLELKPGAALARWLLGAFEAGKGNRSAAIALLRQVIDEYVELGDYTMATRTALRLANLHYGHDPEELITTLTRAAELARLAKNIKLEADALHDLGDAYFAVDRYEESMAALLTSEKLYTSIGEIVEVGTVHNSKGRVYRAHGRLDEALREQRGALDLHRRTTDKYALLQSLNAVAVTYQRMGYLEEARTYLDQAIALIPDVEKQLPSARDFLEANLASVLIDQGQYEQAVPMLQGVIARGVDQFPAIRWGQLAEAYLQLGRKDEAIKAATEAVERCGPSKDYCARAHGMRSQALAAANDRAGAQLEGQIALNLLDEVRKQLLPQDALRREFASHLGEIYTSLIGLNVGFGDARTGLEAAEQARARSFLDLMGSRSLEPIEPGPARVQLSASAASAADLIATSKRLDSAMLSYWVGENEIFVWVTDRAGRVISRRVSVPRSTLLRLVRETKPFDVETTGRKAFPLTTRGSAPMSLASGDAAWRQLYQLLIAPVRDSLPTTAGALLTIIPHDVLNGLSFAALKNTSGRYLLEDYTLHYAPAGALFQFTSARRRADARTGSMLLVSDPALPGQSSLDEPLPRLPGTRAESASIAKYARGATVLQDATASEERIRQLAADRSVLHFATHAIVKEDNPLASKLVLARSGDDSTRDGLLTAEEVYGMRLRADLVVLSACRSGAGAVPGEAMATFARAFLYAGTASLVASVWDVADQPTNQLIPEFYREWFAGADKASALRRAQLKLLADLRAGRITVSSSLGPVPLPEHPVFWAGFVLFGEPR